MLTWRPTPVISASNGTSDAKPDAEFSIGRCTLNLSTRCLLLAVLGIHLFATQLAMAAPPQTEQVNAALDIAETSAKNGLISLSIQAVERSLRAGPPEVSSARPAGNIVHRGARVDTTVPIPLTARQAILRRIPHCIFSLSNIWKRHATATEVYTALRNVVLPPDRPGEVFFYNLPMKVDPLQPDRLPPIRSVGQELVYWAAKANRFDDLKRQLKEHSPDSPVAAMLTLMIGYETGDTQLVQREKKRLQEKLSQGNSRPVAELAAFVGATFQSDGRHLHLAATLLESAGTTLADIDLTEPEKDTPTRAILLAAARSRFALGQNDNAIQLLRTYLMISVRGKYGIASEGLNQRKIAVVSQELYRRGFVGEARELLGLDTVRQIERRYSGMGILDGFDALPDVVTTSAPSATPAATIFPIGDSESNPPRLDLIWVCQLDPTTMESRVLFGLPDFQNVTSPAVSPLGNQVAFDATFPGEAVTSDSRIYVADLNGASMQCLGKGALPSWSPEGKRIVYSGYSPDRGVWIRRADGSAPQLIDETGWSGRWSPDGKKIAYTKLIGRQWDIMVHDIVEDDFFSVLNQQSSFVQIAPGFAWSKQSDGIVFWGTKQIATNDKRELIHLPVFQPQNMQRLLSVSDVSYVRSLSLNLVDGRFVGVVRKLRGAERLAIISPTAKSILSDVDGQNKGRRNVGVAWMPDGKSLIYVSKPRKQ